ncbi:hypothetical protein GE21DRAFT_1084057 [Neurospora crassa]|nr:hypothetical protein GE21DRAFT_1084057 [Neurospora crassa]
MPKERDEKPTTGKEHSESEIESRENAAVLRKTWQVKLKLNKTKARNLMPEDESTAQKRFSVKENLPVSIVTIRACRGIPFSLEKNNAHDRQRNKTPTLELQTYNPRILFHPLPCFRPRTPCH